MKYEALRCPRCGGIVAVPGKLGEIASEDVNNTGDEFYPDLPIAKQNLVARCDCGHVFLYSRLVCVGNVFDDLRGGY